MLDERRVKRMVKLAAYETKSGAEDFKVNDYFQKDYVSFQVLCTLIWVTVGYIAILAVLGITYLGQMVGEMVLFRMIMLVVSVVCIYIVLMLAYAVFAHRYYTKKYQRSCKRVRKFSNDLAALEQLYEKEDA